jgi:hypothetical protein
MVTHVEGHATSRSADAVNRTPARQPARSRIRHGHVLSAASATSATLPVGPALAEGRSRRCGQPVDGAVGSKPVFWLSARRDCGGTVTLVGSDLIRGLSGGGGESVAAGS